MAPSKKHIYGKCNLNYFHVIKVTDLWQIALLQWKFFCNLLGTTYPPNRIQEAPIREPKPNKKPTNNQILAPDKRKLVISKLSYF